MKLDRFRRPRPLSIVLVLVLSLLIFLPQLAYASTYVGYTSTNQGGSTCGGNCEGNTATTDATGEIIQAPFAGQIISAGFFTGSAVPTSIVIMTGATTLGSTNYNCGGAGTCNFANPGQTFTVKDVETLTGLAGSTFFTVALAAPVTVTQNQFVAIVFIRTTDTNPILMFVGTGGQTTTSDVCFNFPSSNPAIGSTSNTGSGACVAAGAAIVGGTFNPVGTTGTTITQTQCYGNCGSPAITLANTNSTHSVNFNQSITLIYEFQSNINGFLLNVTTSIAKNYNNGIQVFISVYEVISCPSGQLPFTLQCPGQFLQGRSQSNPAKGQLSMVSSLGQIPVANGQWVAISITSQFGPLDINDTNTNVPLFQAQGNGGLVSVSPASNLCAGCKMGLWAFIVGNVVTGGGPLTPSPGASCPGFLDCIIPSLVFSLCSNQTPTCISSSGLLWAVLLSIFFSFFVWKMGANIMPGVKLPFGEIFMLLMLVWIFVLTGVGLILVWVPLFFFFVISLLVGKKTGVYL
jgi:hypothetical protein